MPRALRGKENHRPFDTSTGVVRPTAPAPHATMYVCGITPYDATHIGHANTYVAFDMINRVWRDAGHQVRYVQNVTDIDDPLLERAVATGENWRSPTVRQLCFVTIWPVSTYCPRSLHRRCGVDPIRRSQSDAIAGVRGCLRCRRRSLLPGEERRALRVHRGLGRRRHGGCLRRAESEQAIRNISGLPRVAERTSR